MRRCWPYTLEVPLTPLLEIDNLHTSYGRTRVHSGLSLQVDEGDAVAVLGPNGAGKTTLLKAVCGEMRPKRGRIALRGQEISGLSADRICALGVSLVPEGRRIFGSMTVRENLEIGAYARRRSADVRAEIEKIYEVFPILRDKHRQRGGELSGGQQQMLAIGRGLMSQPTLMLLDEPSLGLSPKLTLELREVIRDLRTTFGTTILIVEQNTELALTTATNGYLLKNGAIVESGSVKKLRDSSLLKQLYLGDSAPTHGSRTDSAAPPGATTATGRKQL